MPKASGPQQGVPPTGSINVTWEAGAAAESPRADPEALGWGTVCFNTLQLKLGSRSPRRLGGRQGPRLGAVRGITSNL